MPMQHLAPAAMNASSAMRRQIGVSLIEAMVALAIMGFGILGVVGVQATLRSNGDTARLRRSISWSLSMIGRCRVVSWVVWPSKTFSSS